MKRVAIVAALVGLLASPTLAANTTYPAVAQAPYFVCSLTTTAATPCTVPGQQFFGALPTSGAAVVLVGIANNSVTAQTATVLCYDNATAASGFLAASVGALGPTQLINWPLPGRPLGFGLTCQASALPVGAGIEVYFR